MLLTMLAFLASAHALDTFGVSSKCPEIARGAALTPYPETD
jgi:hypothetical protein